MIIVGKLMNHCWPSEMDSLIFFPTTVLMYMCVMMAVMSLFLGGSYVLHFAFDIECDLLRFAVIKKNLFMVLKIKYKW